MRLRWSIMTVVLLAAATTAAGASGPSLWVQAGTEDFLAGEPDGVALSGDGQLRLAPSLELLHDTGTPRIWAIERAPDGTLYAAVGDEGKVFRVRPGQDEPEVFFTARQLGAQALVWGPDEHLYVATGPRGAIYRVPPDHAGEQLSPWFVPETTYVWAMAFGPDGDLFAATGREARVLRVDPQGSGEILWAPSEAHVTALTVDREGRIVVGTEGKGHIARIDPGGDVFVLWDAPLGEITDLVATEAGIWASAFGSGPEAGEAEDAPPASVAGDGQGGKGAVYRIHADGLVETPWTSEEEGVHSLAAAGSGVVAGTGPDGVLLRLDPDREAVRVGRVDAGEVVAITGNDGEWTVATSNLGRIYRLQRGFRERGEYDSQVKDTGTTSRWGTIRWRGSVPTGTRVQAYSRSGNTETPDDTWSDWAGPYEDATGAALESPPARFVQWRAVLESDDASVTPTLDRVELVYVARNLPPEIASLQVHPRGVVYRQSTSFEDSLPFAQLPGPVAAELRQMNGDTGNAAAGAAAFRGQPFYLAGLRTFTWRATDPNGDSLRHSLQYRGLEEGTWKPLAQGIEESMYVFDTTRVPDGSYLVRLVSSDAPSNPEATAASAQRVSTAFVVDNTPPTVELQAEVRSDTVAVSGRVFDAMSLVQRVEYSVDAGDWHTIMPADGLADSGQEEIEFELDALPPGEHTIVVRVTDTALNRGAGKVTVAVR